MHDDSQPPTSPSGADPQQSTETIATATQDAKAAVRGAFEEATDRVKEAGSEAKAKGADKVDAAMDGAAEALRQVSSQLKNAVDGLGGEQLWAEKAFQAGADGLDRVSDYLASGKFDDFTRDIQTFARSNPAAFLAGGVALGFLIARVGKTAAHHASGNSPAEADADAGFPTEAIPTPVDGSALGLGGLS